MKRKWKYIAGIALLIAAIVLCRKAGLHMIQSIETTGDTESVGSSGTMTVLVDAGHGSADPGKVGVQGSLEKDINLVIAKKVKAMLIKQNITVVMTREDDDGLADSKVEDLKARVTLINETKPDLAVSVHQNSYQTADVSGAQVFYYTHSAEGEAAALVLQEALRNVDKGNTRQAKANTTYYLLKKTSVPTVIVECGFLSNPEEAEMLTTDEYQEKVAQAICDGVMEYLNKSR